VAFVVKLLREASDEMRAAAAWYEERREGLGDRFLDIVRATIRRVSEAPLASAPWHVPRLLTVVRRRPVPGFPFFIIYTTEPALVVDELPAVLVEQPTQMTVNRSINGAPWAAGKLPVWRRARFPRHIADSQCKRGRELKRHLAPLRQLTEHAIHDPGQMRQMLE
jgi:hypothetical protein